MAHHMLRNTSFILPSRPPRGTATGTPVSDPASFKKHVPPSRVGDRRSYLANAQHCFQPCSKELATAGYLENEKNIFTTLNAENPARLSPEPKMMEDGRWRMEKTHRESRAGLARHPLFFWLCFYSPASHSSAGISYVWCVSCVSWLKTAFAETGGRQNRLAPRPLNLPKYRLDRNVN